MTLMNRWGQWLGRHTVLGLILLLLGCASQQTFRQGQALLEAGKPEEGLAQIGLAMDEQPGNIEYRAYYYRQRELWVNRLIRGADSARINRQWEAATAGYQRALAIDADNGRAKEGLLAIEAAQRREALLEEAGDLAKKGELETARDKVRRVLAEEPSSSRARTLAEKIERQRQEAASPASRMAAKFRRPVSVEFKDANIKTVFEMLSKAAGVNFILDRDLRPDLKVTVYARHTTVEAAVQNILSSSQLGRKILDADSVMIYPLSKKGDYEEMMVRTFYLNSVEPKRAMDLIKTVVKSKDVFVDEQLNILVIRDSADAVRLAEKLIAAYDLGDPEVLLEVEVLEISSAKLLELGVKYPNQLSVGVAGGSNGSAQLTFKELRDFTSDMAVLSINDPAFVLNLHATDGSSNLLANPRIRVKNHKKARIHIGDRVPVITTTSTSTGFSSESVNYLDVGLKLDVEPSVMVADEVSIDIGLEVSNIVNEITSKNGTLTYRLGTRNANTTLRLKDGETQMLAGLIKDEDRTSTDRVPGISKLPIIGRLFSSNKDTHDKSEIVLLITPHIVRNIVPPDASYVEFPVGTENGSSGIGVPFASPSTMIPAPAPIQPLQPLQPVPMEMFPVTPAAGPDQQEESPTPVPAIPPPPPLPGAPAADAGAPDE